MKLKRHNLIGYTNKYCLSEDVEKLEAKSTDMKEWLELIIGQSDQCPICRRYDFKELGHVSTCFMRTL